MVDLSGKTILLILCGSPARRTVLEAVHRTHVRIVCVNPNIAWANDLVHEWVIAPCDDRPASLHIIQEYVARTHQVFDGLVCYDEFGLALAALVGETLHLPFLSSNIIECARDKYGFRKHCAEHGVPAPKCVHLNPDIVCDPKVCNKAVHTLTSTFDFFSNIETVAAQVAEAVAAASLSFPIVIKPTHGAGKMCTRKASTALEAAEAVCMLHARMAEYIDRWRMTFDEARSMVLEEYLEGGPEVDADCLVQKGKIVFMSINENREAVEPWFLEQGGMTPPGSLTQAQQVELRRLCESVFATYGEGITAAVHFEAKFTPRGVYPIELNLRLGGAETYLLVKSVYKVDLIVEALKMQLGVMLNPADFPDPIANPWPVYASSVNIVPKWSGLGRLRTLHIDTSLASDPHCGGMAIFFKEGDIVKCAPAGNHYLGWMIAVGTSHADAEAQLVRLLGLITYVLEPVS